MTAAAVIAVALLALLAVFQSALALGAPWGQAAWGGRHRRTLPAGLRLASAATAVAACPLMALYVLRSAEVIDAPPLPGAGAVAMWVLVGYFALGTLANLASRSPRERFWGPVALALAVCCAVIALGA